MARYQRLLQISLVLLLLTFGLFKSKDCLAFTSDYNFDVYFPNYQYNLGEWWDLLDKPEYQRFNESVGLTATTTHFYGETLASLNVSTSTTNYFRASTTNPTEISFKFFIDSSAPDNTEQWWYFKNAAGTSLYKFEWGYDDDGDDVYFLRLSPSPYQYLTHSVLDKNVWYEVKIVFNANSLDWYFNDVFATSSSATGIGSTTQIYSQNNWNHHVYLDELQIKDDIFTAYDTGDVEIIELTDWYGDIIIGAEEILSYDNPTFCTIGYSCRIWVGYNFDAIGNTLYLLDENDEILTQHELLNGQFLREYLDVPTQTSAQTLNYNILLEEATTTKVFPIQIVWQDEPTFLMDFFEQYNCETICNNVSSSTGIFDEFRYGVECGLRKVGCWALVPATSTVMDFSTALTSMKYNFPFTIITQVSDLFAQDYTSGTSTEIRAYNILPGFNPVLASTTMMSDTYGSLWNDYIYVAMKYFVFVSFLGYIIVRALTIMRNKKEEENI